MDNLLPDGFVPGERQVLADAVEKVPSWLRRRVLIEADARGCRNSSHRELSCQADLGKLAQVLGGCGEVELVSGTIGST